MSVTADIQSLTPGTLIELFMLDTTPAGEPSIYRFHAGANGLGVGIVWGGLTFTQFPVEASGFERRSSGTLPRPVIRVANVDGLIGALALQLDDLIGSKLTRIRTFAKYLDAVNFPGAVNPTADPNQVLDQEIWVVDRKARANNIYVDFELATPFDVAGVKLPRRQVIQNTCSWLAIGGYRGPYCGYTGGPVADRNDTPVGTLTEDRCGGRLASCKLRFGEYSPLPFGGFPGVGLLR
ncbi:phage minor tail protein L [Thauera sinica]|uniref:Phage minor tail protein L n=1 Tax=Thauera sinica TaxID=2665146 RepID=A0ABW1AR88_9RHOO|nr:phage minor tail protein L [Thauera sp. K11]ATE60173.1 phage minor tail protein L [Thauera sp. K11]